MFEHDDQKHAESAKKYPTLHLSDGEYVVAEVRRHPIGEIAIWLGTLFVAGLIIAITVAAYRQSSMSDLPVDVSPDLLLGGAMLLTILVLLIGYVGYIIYRDNHFYVTNESVIQHIRTGLFTSREQTIALGGVEDASFRQEGILQYLLGYGSIRLSTVGDENTYRFTIVQNPRVQLKALNDAVEDFKRRHVYEGTTGAGPSATN